ncbi:unnamed protein product [Arabidopsis thaliana]|uniref:Uncharacterized protein n=1 Tax=Arabidopsis thaliana TaxID=3702 RepID=A0A5S9YAY2_ARATH|nr:unnamed protein product [Arabidopsis thaliana]
MLLLLFETACGFALFEVLREFSDDENLDDEFSTAEKARKMVRLKAIDKFGTKLEAHEAVANLLDGAPSDGFCKFLKANCDGGTILLVSNTKLGELIKEKLNIDCVHRNAVTELLRGVRSHIADLIYDLGHNDLVPMSLGLSCSLARHKLQFSSDKVDAMIIQALASIDDIEKELNKFAMRLLDDEVEAELKEAAEMSMGYDISELDILNIEGLCKEVLSLAEYKDNLHNYLKTNMNKYARELTKAVGVLVGAWLISHAAKEPWEKGKAAKLVARYAARAVRKDVFCTGQYNSRAVENRLKTLNPAADSFKKRKHEGEEDTDMPAEKKRRG